MEMFRIHLFAAPEVNKITYLQSVKPTTNTPVNIKKTHFMALISDHHVCKPWYQIHCLVKTSTLSAFMPQLL